MIELIGVALLAVLALALKTRIDRRYWE